MFLVSNGAVWFTVIQTCHLVRIVRIQYGFWPFLRWYGRITLWYGFEANYWKTIYELHIAKQNSFIIDTTSFSAKFLKNGRFRLPWSMIDLVNQRRRPNPTVAPREVKLRFWFFAAGCRLLLHNVAFFCKLHRDMNRENVFAIHRCINEGYGLIQIFTEQIRISPTKLWRVWWLVCVAGYYFNFSFELACVRWWLLHCVD